MQSSEITVPEHLKATCHNCETVRTFSATSGDTESDSAQYDCEECGWTMVLLTNPAKHPATV